MSDYPLVLGVVVLWMLTVTGAYISGYAAAHRNQPAGRAVRNNLFRARK